MTSIGGVLDLGHLAELAELVLRDKAELREGLQSAEDHAAALTMIRTDPGSER